MQRLLTYNPVAHEHTHYLFLIYDKELTRLEMSVCGLLLSVCKAVSLLPRVSWSRVKNLFGGESMGDEDVKDV